MGNRKIYKVTNIIYCSKANKIFFEEDFASSKNIKTIKRENIIESVYDGFYDYTNSLEKGDYFKIV